MLSTVLEFTFTADLAPVLDVGKTPAGRRVAYVVSGGEVRGHRLSGILLPGGSDWMTHTGDGFAEIDVRAQIRTDDDAVILMSYRGALEVTEAIKRAPQGIATDFDDQYYRCTPRLETGSAAYAWVNHTIFVSRGRLLPGPAVEYEVYRVA